LETRREQGRRERLRRGKKYVANIIRDPDELLLMPLCSIAIFLTV